MYYQVRFNSKCVKEFRTRDKAEEFKDMFDISMWGAKSSEESYIIEITNPARFLDKILCFLRRN